MKDIFTANEIISAANGCSDAKMRRIQRKEGEYTWHEGEPGPLFMVANIHGAYVEASCLTNTFNFALAQATMMRGDIFDMRPLDSDGRPRWSDAVLRHLGLA